MDYDKEVEKNTKRNEKYLIEFEDWLINKGLKEGTIGNHLSNVDLFINYYLNYYDIIKAEDGLDKIFDFLDDWFIRKCSWSSKSTMKGCVVSLKKFYCYMSENNYVDVNLYNKTFAYIKKNMDRILKNIDEYYKRIEFDNYYD